MKNESVKIEKLDHYGRGIVKKDGIIFIDNSLPNEIVDYEIVNKKSKYMEGKVIDIIKSSNERVEPICPYYSECGGCNIMHLNYAGQLKFKENKVKEVLKKFSNFDNVKSIIGSEQYFYRNKVTLQVKNRIGFYKNKSYDLIPVDKCYIASPKINEIIKALNAMNLENVNQVVIRCSTKESIITFYTDKKLYIDIQKINMVDNIVLVNKNYNILKGNGYIVEEVNNLKFIISPSSFFQVNTNGMMSLYDKVLEYCNLNGNEQVLDLYCGTGTIGLYLANKAKKVLGIEINEDAIKDALNNKKLNNINNIEFKIGDVKDTLDNEFSPNIVVVDPPRAGLDKKVIQELIKLKPQKIVYVSCDVVTLARDINLLSSDYEAIECTPVDMFPNTYHVETVCLLNHR